MKQASSPTKEGIERLINEFYYSTSYRVIGHIGSMNVYNSKGLFEKAVVQYKNNRFVFYTVS